ncbi:hypothetical protein KY284_012397 [Solanum tuberosum]|nr:hypothetical protein KY284_012397 [Solanum tuberosum]
MTLGLSTTQEIKVIDENMDLRKEVVSQDAGSSHGFSAQQLRQISQAVSLFTQNNNSASNSDAYANTTGLGYGEDDWIG